MSLDAKVAKDAIREAINDQIDPVDLRQAIREAVATWLDNNYQAVLKAIAEGSRDNRHNWPSAT